MNKYHFNFFYNYLATLLLVTGAALVCAGALENDVDQNMHDAGAAELYESDKLTDKLPEMPHPPMATIHSEIPAEHDIHALMPELTAEKKPAQTMDTLMTPSGHQQSESSGMTHEAGQEISQQEQHEDILQELHTLKRKIKNLKKIMQFEFQRLNRKVEAGACRCTSSLNNKQ